MLDYMKSIISEEDSYTTYRYIMTVDGEETGIADVVYDENSAYVERIDIEEGRRNQGFGTQFIQYLCEEYGEIFLAPDNEDAKRLYERLGREVTDIGDWAYSDQGYGVYSI